MKISAVIFAVLALVLSVYLVKDVFANVWLFILSVLVSIFYVVPIFGKRLREIPVVKSALIAVVWTSVLLLIPWLNEGKDPMVVQDELTAFCCFFIAISIPFDIRDLEQDRLQHKTLPLLLGTTISKILSILLLGVFCLIIANINQEIGKSLLFVCVTVITALLILFTNSTRSIYFFAAIDGTMVLIGLVYFFG
ncbi:MAG: hypothetical protein E6Q38_00055 [Crocinitomicaceae bacterium]|nr:MAG: hypothetical protein E6Q38_00055 [Crocinitomicaceae bacterium]